LAIGAAAAVALMGPAHGTNIFGAHLKGPRRLPWAAAPALSAISGAMLKFIKQSSLKTS